MRAPDWTELAVWRLGGAETVELSMEAAQAKILYPVDLGIEVSAAKGKLSVRFPRTNMACILRL
jgi:hypothetical protein